MQEPSPAHKRIRRSGIVGTQDGARLGPGTLEELFNFPSTGVLALAGCSKGADLVRQLQANLSTGICKVTTDFSGLGGFELAVRNVAAQTAWDPQMHYSSDIDKVCLGVLSSNSGTSHMFPAQFRRTCDLRQMGMNPHTEQRIATCGE